MIAIKDAKIITMEEKDYEKASLIIEKGKIKKIGKDLDLSGISEVIDAEGAYLLPGFIDAHTHLGILEEIYSSEGDDVNELSDPITPQLRALDGINPFDLSFQDALKSGVTTVMVAPGSANVIGGTVTILKTAGETFREQVLSEEAGLKISFGENPKSIYGQQEKMPTTRMGAVSLLREAFCDGLNYKKEKDKKRDLKLETLEKVLDRKIPLRAHAHRADDILTALRVAEEFDLELIVEHCTEGHKIIKELQEGKIACVLGPSFNNRDKVELKEISFKTAKILNDAGILISLTTDHPETPINYLLLCAGLAYREGLEKREALKAITINPAKILKIDDKLGSIKEGKIADLVLLSGDPFSLKTKVLLTMISGRMVYREK